MTLTIPLKQALDDLNGPSYNITSPHPVLDRGHRLAAIAQAASDAGMGNDEMRAAVRASMDARLGQNGDPRPFPQEDREEVLIRIGAMMDFIEWMSERDS